MHQWPDALMQFLQRPVPIFIHLATVNRSNGPLCCRGYGFRLEPERDMIWIYVLRSQWLRMNRDVDHVRELAALLTSGIDNESYQVKGEFQGNKTLGKDDAASVEHQRKMTSLHTPVLTPLLNVSPSDCLAVGFKIRAVYLQTPGPDAGSLIGERGDC